MCDGELSVGRRVLLRVSGYDNLNRRFRWETYMSVQYGRFLLLETLCRLSVRNLKRLGCRNAVISDINDLVLFEQRSVGGFRDTAWTRC